MWGNSYIRYLAITTCLYILLLNYSIAANLDTRYVLVFGGDFCTYCHLMEKNVWPQPVIIQLLKNYKDKQAHIFLTERRDDEQWFKRYKIKSLPTVIIIDVKSGREIKRATGYMTVDELQLFLTSNVTNSSVQVFGKSCRPN